MTEDAYWQRPAEGVQEPPPAAQPVSAPYTGAPRSSPPPHGWRPPLVIQPAAPRSLPPQDRERLDREEQAATVLTKGIGLLAGAIILVLLLILCGRWLF